MPRVALLRHRPAPSRATQVLDQATPKLESGSASWMAMGLARNVGARDARVRIRTRARPNLARAQSVALVYGRSAMYRARLIALAICRCSHAEACRRRRL